MEYRGDLTISRGISPDTVESSCIFTFDPMLDLGTKQKSGRRRVPLNSWRLFTPRLLRFKSRSLMGSCGNYRGVPSELSTKFPRGSPMVPMRTPLGIPVAYHEIY